METTQFPTPAELLGAIKRQMFVHAVILANCAEVTVGARESSKLKRGKLIPVGRFSAYCLLSSGKFGERFIGMSTGETFLTPQEAIDSRTPLIELAKADPALKTPKAIQMMRDKLAEFIEDIRLSKRFREQMEKASFLHV